MLTDNRETQTQTQTRQGECVCVCVCVYLFARDARVLLVYVTYSTQSFDLLLLRDVINRRYRYREDSCWMGRKKYSQYVVAQRWKTVGKSIECKHTIISAWCLCLLQ